MIISIASGKGGTGKTTLALLLAAVRDRITVIDCDVEEPNCHLFLKVKEQTAQRVSITIPQIKTDLCNGCETCSTVCRFNAIAVFGGKALLFDELCHSCGGCLLACRQNAIREVPKDIGRITTGSSTLFPGTVLISGLLKVGVPSAVPLIKTIVKQSSLLPGDILLDCPPGTSCSMAAAITDSDYCILVTEPTPLGRHDLELAMNITQLLYIPTGVVINRSDGGTGDERIESLCRSRSIPMLAKIPYSFSFARQYAAGILSTEFKAAAIAIWRRLNEEGGQHYEGISHCQWQRRYGENLY